MEFSWNVKLLFRINLQNGKVQKSLLRPSQLYQMWLFYAGVWFDFEEQEGKLEKLEESVQFCHGNFDTLQFMVMEDYSHVICCWNKIKISRVTKSV